MAESKFTPGPWFVSEDDRDGMEWNRHIAIDPDGENRICFMAHGGPERDDEFEANACLIAAAPELYEALTDALAGLRYIREHYHDERTATGDLYGVGFDRVEGKAQAALAKVRGEQP